MSRNPSTAAGSFHPSGFCTQSLDRCRLAETPAASASQFARVDRRTDRERYALYRPAHCRQRTPTNGQPASGFRLRCRISASVGPGVRGLRQWLRRPLTHDRRMFERDSPSSADKDNRAHTNSLTVKRDDASMFAEKDCRYQSNGKLPHRRRVRRAAENPIRTASRAFFA